jgi:uncharacterized protein (TIGR02118 family)
MHARVASSRPVDRHHVRCVWCVGEGWWCVGEGMMVSFAVRFATVTCKLRPFVGRRMLKLVNLLVRADDLTHEEFVEYWYEEHAPLARDLPNAKKYATSVPSDPERSEYDGIVELYFDDMAALTEAFESETGQAVQADLAEFAKPDEGPTMYVEETVQFDGIDEPESGGIADA